MRIVGFYGGQNGRIEQTCLRRYIVISPICFRGFCRFVRQSHMEKLLENGIEQKIEKLKWQRALLILK